jgi:thiol-disulfide isomerase/thioredoxin
MKKKISLFCALSIMVSVAATAAYRIEVTVAGAENVKVYLARYEGVNVVNVDSAKFSAAGKVTFANQKAVLPGGLYLLRFKPEDTQQQVEFLVSGDSKFDLSITANTLNIEKSLKYAGSAENIGFKAFIDSQQRLGRASQDLQQRFQKFQNSQDSVVAIQQRYMRLMENQKKELAAALVKYKGTLLATLMQSMQEPEMPQLNVPEGAENPDSLRQLQFVAFAKEHFFDNFNLADARIIYAPMYENRLMAFFQQIMLREPVEDINAGIDLLLKKAEAGKPVYKYTLTWLYDRYTDSPIEGHHVVGMHLCRLMSDSTRVDWLTDRDKTKLKQNIKRYTLNPVGSIATDLTLETIDGEIKSLHKINGPYAVLYFFNPGCGSCRMATPVLHEIYDRFKDRGLQVFAVYPDKDTVAWKKYVEENGYTDWVNVWDAEGTAGIYEKYSLHAIPQIYVLDENKRIMNKDVYMNDLEGILYVAFLNVKGS